MAAHDRTQAESPTKGNEKCKSTASEKEASLSTEDTASQLVSLNALISVQEEKEQRRGQMLVNWAGL